jgi:hypothetical protein
MVKLRSARTPESGAFLVMDAAKSSARAAGKDIMDLSVGSSDCEFNLAWRLLAAPVVQPETPLTWQLPLLSVLTCIHHEPANNHTTFVVLLLVLLLLQWHRPLRRLRLCR